MISIKAYWESLNKAQIASIEKTQTRADMEGIILHIEDAVDIWYLMPTSIRGKKPGETTEKAA